jgi:hypothetical protein
MGAPNAIETVGSCTSIRCVPAGGYPALTGLWDGRRPGVAVRLTAGTVHTLSFSTPLGYIPDCGYGAGRA